MATQTAHGGSGGQLLELSIVIPCLNEAETLAVCIDKAAGFLASSGVAGEVVVADNGSTDSSRQIAVEHGARVVDVPERGYGAALLGGIAGARGRFVVMGDGDDSYDFTALGPFVAKLREGFELVMGNRFLGGVRPGAMPVLHRFLGNPVLSFLGRLFFGAPVGDFHCGLRAFDRSAIQRLDLRTTGMEFASEMVVKATLHGLRITEVPTVLHPDGRSVPPKLRTWRDGWRHLRFLLLYSPRWLFLYPGLALTAAGVLLGGWLLPGPRHLGSVTLDVHTLLFASMAVLVGFQMIGFALFTKVFAIGAGLLPEDPRVAEFSRRVSLETGLIAGGLLAAAGLAGSLYALGVWEQAAFGNLEPTRMLRVVIPAVTAFTLGIEVMLASLFLSVLNLKRH
jgi:hypothetical protein